MRKKDLIKNSHLILLVVSIIIFVSFIGMVKAYDNPGHINYVSSVNESIVTGNINLTNYTINITSNSGTFSFIEILNTSWNTISHIAATNIFNFFSFWSLDFDDGTLDVISDVDFEETVNLPSGSTIDGSEICSDGSPNCAGENGTLEWINVTNPTLLGGNITSGGNISLNETFLSARYVDESQGDSIITEMLINQTLENNDFSATANIDWSKFNKTLSSLYNLSDRNLSYVVGILPASRGGTNISNCSNGQVFKWNDAQSTYECSSDLTGIDGTGLAGKVAIYSDSDSLTYDSNLDWSATNKLHIGASGDATETLQVSSGSLLAGDPVPELVGNVTSGTYLNAVDRLYYEDGYVYATSPSDDYFTIVEVSDPYHPSIVGFITDGTALNGAGAVIVEGEVAYVSAGTAGMDYHLSTIDISNKSSPEILDTYTSAFLEGSEKMYLQGNYLFTTQFTSDTLVIFDVSDPENIRYVSNVSNLNGPWDVVSNGNYLFVTEYNDLGITSIDIRDIEKPTILHEYVDGVNLGKVSGMDLQGNYLFVTANADGYIRSYDVSDPNNITEEGSLGGLTAIMGIDVFGDYAVATAAPTGNFIWVLDIGDPSVMVELSELSTTADIDSPRDVFVNGRYAYIAETDDDEISIMDIGSLILPRIDTTSYESGMIRVDNDAKVGAVANIHGALTVGDRGLLSTGGGSFDNGTLIVYGSNGTVGIKTRPGSSALKVGANTIFENDFNASNGLTLNAGSYFTLQGSNVSLGVDGTELDYLADSLINLSDSETSGILPVANGGFGRTLNETVGLLVGNGTNPVNILSCSHNQLPKIVGTIWTCANFSGLRATVVGNALVYFTDTYEVTGNSLFVYNDTTHYIGLGNSTPEERLDIENGSINLTNPAKIKYVSNYGGNIGRALAVYVQDNFAYVAHATGFYIFDVTNPNTPYILSNVSAGTIYNLEVVGNYLFVDTASVASLSIYDVSDKTNPVLLDTWDDNGIASYSLGIDVVGPYAYVTTYDDDDLIILDITNPSDITYVNHYENTTALSRARDVAVNDGYAYTANYLNYSVSVINVTDPYNMEIVAHLGTASTIGAARQVEVRENVLYVISENLGFITINVSDPRNPLILDTLSITSPHTFALEGDYAYVASWGGDRVYIIDISDPTSLTEIVHYVDNTMLDGIYSIDVDKGYLYIGSYNTKDFIILDATDVYSPNSETGSTLTGNLKARNFEGTSLNVLNAITIGGDLVVQDRASFGGGILNVMQNGSVGIQTTNTTHTLTLNGTLNANAFYFDGSINTTSDIEFKSSDGSVHFILG